MAAGWLNRLKSGLGLRSGSAVSTSGSRQETLPQRPPGPLIWVHLGPGTDPTAVTLVLTRLRLDQGPVAVIVTQDPGLEPVELPMASSHLECPANSDAADRILLSWLPEILLWVGAGWGPTILDRVAARGIPALCVDARPDLQPARRWRASPHHSELATFHKMLTGTGSDARRLRVLGALESCIETIGWLESSVGAMPCNNREWAELGDLFETRPLWLAVDVADAEYDVVHEGHRLASRLSHRLLLICVPGDPASGPGLRDRFEADGLLTALRSEEEDPREETQVYIADTEGELGLWYRFAPATFMGQTLAGSRAGRSPMEPAALGSVVVHGPRTMGHDVAYDRLADAGACCAIGSGVELGQAIERLQAPDKAAEIASAAWQVLTTGAEATDRAVELLNEALNRAAD